MFAVDPASLRDRYPGKHKGISASNRKITYMRGRNTTRYHFARRVFVFNFLPLFTSRRFLAELSGKIEEKFLCDLCSSGAGGENV